MTTPSQGEAVAAVRNSFEKWRRSEYGTLCAAHGISEIMLYAIYSSGYADGIARMYLVTASPQVRPS